MKKLVLMACISCFTYTMYAQQNNDIAIKPVVDAKSEVKKPAEDILLIKEEVFDFGKIPQGKPVHHIFMIKNTGQESKITVGYNAAAEGPFSKFITITYNETGSKQISIKGEVWKTPAASAPENKSLNELNN